MEKPEATATKIGPVHTTSSRSIAQAHQDTYDYNLVGIQRQINYLIDRRDHAQSYAVVSHCNKRIEELALMRKQLRGY